ncbi:MAG: hypothetical protein P0116_07295 [Candidatus Nitrosocosmicus sp.]|nr:hypothetical protein [Candidatus Nitrosocosmicus sp.]
MITGISTTGISPLESPPWNLPAESLSSSASKWIYECIRRKSIVEETGAVTIGTNIASINNNTGI